MYSFLVNPASRSGRGQKYWERIKIILEERKIPYQVYFSKGPGDMVKLARRLTASSAGREDIHLVVLGGDGTANEVVQGIEDFAGTRFSYIPTGSSNDLARDTGISRDPAKALECILTSAREHLMDVGFLHYNTAYNPADGQLPDNLHPDRRFLVSCGIGFDAGVCEEAMHSRIKDILNKMGLGKLTYLGIALKQLIHSGNATAELTAERDGKPSQKVNLSRLMFIACMSHCYEGGGFYFCPGADASDGILDLCTVSSVPKWKVLMVLPTAFTGKHYRYKGVERYSGKSIRIRTTIPLWVHTDGEVSCLSDDIQVNCSRQLLRFYY